MSTLAFDERASDDNVKPALCEHDRITFAGISVNQLTLADLMKLLYIGIANNEKWVIATHNLHSLYLFPRLRRFREYFATAEWVYMDGMSLVALARLYGHRVNRAHRVTFIDWTEPIMKAAVKNRWRVFYLGSDANTASKAMIDLRERFPQLQIVARSGYFNAERDNPENLAVLKAIDSYRPHLVMVGMGMPRQELWIYDNRDDIRANIIVPCGAALEYVAGAVPTPPRWAGRLGLEWAFRLASEPRRLAGRYLGEPWEILGRVISDLVFRRWKQEAPQR